MALFNIKSPQDMIVGIIMLVLALQILVQTLPTLITAIINLSGVSNLSFASFFQANGVVLLMLSIGIVLAIFGVMGIKRKSAR